MSKYMALITFETRAIDNLAETNAKGHWVGREIDIAYITPVDGGGGRLVCEKEVTPELLSQWKINPETKHFGEAYIAWKEGAEPPVNGQDLKNWPPISPSQLKQLNSRNIRSVEELAELPDTSLTSFGPGFRLVRDKAREWLKSSSDIGVVVAQMTQLKEQNNLLTEENKKLRSINEQLLDRLAGDDTPKRGRPKAA